MGTELNTFQGMVSKKSPADPPPNLGLLVRFNDKSSVVKKKKKTSWQCKLRLGE
jgi:hypothetical protein